MRKLEYVFSLALAMLLLGGMVAWTHATHSPRDTALSCRSGKATSAVFFKGMSIYPQCRGGKRG